MKDFRIIKAYDHRGREMRLPNNGKVLLPVGAHTFENNEFTLVEQPTWLIKVTRQIDYETWHMDYLKEAR